MQRNIPIQFGPQQFGLCLQYAPRTFLPLHLLPRQPYLSDWWFFESWQLSDPRLLVSEPTNFNMFSNCSPQYSFSQRNSNCLCRSVYIQIWWYFQQKLRKFFNWNVFLNIYRYSVRNNRWIVVGIESTRGVPPLDLLSFSAAVQINERDILVFGGYDNS